MSVFRRAMLYIGRKRGKTVLLLVILIILTTLVLMGLSIQKGTEAAAAELRKTLGGYFKVELDLESETPNFVDEDFVRQIALVPGISGYNAMDIYYLITPQSTLSPARFTAEGDPKAQLARFLSNTDSSLHEYFVTKTFTLLDGRHIRPDDQNKALVSDVFAGANGLQIGDRVTGVITEDVAPDTPIPQENTFDYEIVGIYHVNNPQEVGLMTAECDVADNFIFTDAASGKQVVSALMGRDTDRYRYGATFFAEDPRDLPEIVNWAQTLPGVNWDGLKVSINDQAYRASAQPLEKLGGFTSMLILVILIVSVVLLSLILTMWMRDRVHEIGVYLSIGIKKAGVFGQHILECMGIAVVAFCIAWGISGIAAGPVGNMVLRAMPEEQVIEQPSGMQVELFNDPVKIDYEANKVEEVNVSVGFLEWITVVGLGSAVIVLSVGLSSVIVFRMKPKDILSSMG